MRHWSLGTTSIPREGRYCVCAIDKSGNIVHEAMSVLNEVPAGQVLNAIRGDWNDTGKRDEEGLLRVAQACAESWTVERLGQEWSSPKIFGGSIRWNFEGEPQRPACTAQSYGRLDPHTRILRLNFSMKLITNTARSEFHYGPTNESLGEWRVKYNGMGRAISRLPIGTLVAAFVSHSQYQKEYAYLKIGSLLWVPVKDQLPANIGGSDSSRLLPILRGAGLLYEVYSALIKWVSSNTSHITYEQLRRSLPETFSRITLQPEFSGVIVKIARSCKERGVPVLTSVVVSSLHRLPDDWYFDAIYPGQKREDAVQQWHNDAAMVARVDSAVYPRRL